MFARTAHKISLTVLSAVLVTACNENASDGARSEPADTPTRQVTTSSTAPIFDPPKAFADKTMRITDDETALLGPGLAYTSMAPGQETSGRRDPTLTIRAISLADGEERWRVATPIQTGMRLRIDNSFFRLTDSASPPRLVWAGVHRIVGSGTQRDQFELVTGAVDASTGNQIWSTKKPFDDIDTGKDAYVRVVGADDTHVALAISYPDATESGAIVDARHGKITDTPTGFAPVGLDRGIVVGRQTARRVAQGLDAVSGQVRWTSDARVGDLGASVITDGVVQFVEDTILTPGTMLLSAADGAVRATVSGRQDCSSAAADVLVCVGFDRVEALEASGKPLWSLPDKAAGRVMPYVSTVYSGLVYARSNKGVILDARTGKDLVTGLDWTPDEIVPGYGIERNKTEGLLTCRAIA
jgi:outer membrane protein assembly factor BamB